MQTEDLTKCIEYFKDFQIDTSTFNGNYLALIRKAHQIAFTMRIWIHKSDDDPEWVTPYLKQLKADSVQLLPSVALGNRRALHLYERACIEDFLRYFYYFDHRIEHMLLQTQPTKYQTMDFLLNWIKDYPLFASCKESVSESCASLTAGYKELSRTVHGTTLSDVTLFDNLKDLFQPFRHPIRERKLMNLVFGNVFFLLYLFRIPVFQKLSLDEKNLACQHLSDQQKRILSGID
jgi:hypothetical protein